MDVTTKNPSGRSITFEEKRHRYTDDAGVIYRSCTKVIHELFPPFDADKIAVFSAKKRGITVEEIKAEWKEAGRVACDLGTRMHKYAEDYLKGIPSTITPKNEKEENIIKSFNVFAPKFLDNYDVIETEKIIFSPAYRLAGTVDLIAKRKKDGTIWVMDWKTNKEIVMETLYNSYGYLFLSHIHDTNYWHYALQLNIYRTLLHHEGYYDMNSSNMSLFHLTPEKVTGMVAPCLDMEIQGIYNYMSKS